MHVLTRLLQQRKIGTDIPIQTGGKLEIQRHQLSIAILKYSSGKLKVPGLVLTLPPHLHAPAVTLCHVGLVEQ